MMLSQGIVMLNRSLVKVNHAILSKMASMESQTIRCLSVSSSLLLKRPVFHGPTPPKKPLNAYMLFLMDKVREDPISGGDLVFHQNNMKAIGEKWRNLSQSEQQVYKNRAIQLKLEYDNVYREFLKKEIGSEKEQEAYLQSLKEYRAAKQNYISEFRLKKKGLLKPHKKSGYNLFMKDLITREKIDSMDAAQALITDGSKQWSRLTDEEKSIYNKKADESWKREIKEYEKRYAKAVKEGILPQPRTEKKTEKVEKKDVSEVKKNVKRKEKKKVVENTRQAVAKQEEEILEDDESSEDLFSDEECEDEEDAIDL